MKRAALACALLGCGDRGSPPPVAPAPAPRVPLDAAPAFVTDAMTEPTPPPDASVPAPAAEQRYRVYDGTVLILEVSNQPGPIRSTARASGPPVRHPFLSASARSAAHEDQLRKLLVAATSFEAFVASLTAAGFRLEAVTP